MKTKKLFLAALFMATPLFFFSCSDDDDAKDTTGPTITLNKPTDDEAFHLGENIEIDFSLADESGINNYKVDIHWAGDGHVHTSSVTIKVDEAEGTEWAYQKVYEDKKGQKTAHLIITTDEIPTGTKGGHYHLGILATDLAGNETRKYIEIEIEDHAH